MVRAVGKPVAWMIAAGLALAGSDALSRSSAAAHQSSSPSETAIGERVLHTLLSSPLGKTAPPANYQVIVVQKQEANAWLRPSGRLQIDTGMLPVLDEQPGAWAVVVGHEIGHVVIFKGNESYFPAFRREVEESYRHALTLGSDAAAAEVLLAAPLGRRRAYLPLSQEKEYEADRVGLLLMAEAGYHPDFAIAVDNRMGWLLRDGSWRARQDHLMKAYNVALAIFQARWPNAAQSPGGVPPPIGKFDNITIAPDTGDRSIVFHVTFHARNTAGLVVRVVAVFQEGRTLVKSALPEYRSPGGALELNATVPGKSQLSREVTLRLPAAAVTSRRLLAVLHLMVGEEQLDVSRFVSVELPSPH